jgi:ankyrin repeat protein
MKSKLKQLDRDLLDSVILRDIARIRELLAQGADVNTKDLDEHQETPLMLAVVRHSVGVVSLLLDAGAEVDAKDDWGRTALFYAPVSSEIFGVLLRAKANVHSKDEEGNTILMRKISECASLADVETFLQLGVDPSLQNEAGETALDIAESLGLVKVIALLRSRAG